MIPVALCKEFSSQDFIRIVNSLHRKIPCKTSKLIWRSKKITI